jgi:hypothetical protein
VPRSRSTLVLRIEDLLIAGWVAIASPLIFRFDGKKGPFDPDQPIQGLVELAAVLGVLLCLAARQKVDPASPPQPSLVNRGVVGPLVGALLLVTISGFTALGAPTAAIYIVLIATAAGMVAIRIAGPPLNVLARRALVSPFVVVAAGLYWTFIESVMGSVGAATIHRLAPLNPQSAPALLFLFAFSAIYYAMLIFAPRQIAEREGGVIQWLLRYAAFVVSIVLGIGWLSVLST